METGGAGLGGPRAEKCLGGGTQGSEPSFHCGPRDSKEQMAGLGAAGAGPEGGSGSQAPAPRARPVPSPPETTHTHTVPRHWGSAPTLPALQTARRGRDQRRLTPTGAAGRTDPESPHQSQLHSGPAAGGQDSEAGVGPQLQEVGRARLWWLGLPFQLSQTLMQTNGVRAQIHNSSQQSKSRILKALGGGQCNQWGRTPWRPLFTIHALPSSLAVFQTKTAESWDGVGSVQGEGDRKEWASQQG